MFAYTGSAARVEVAFTDRHGGVSTGAYAELNLAAASEDEPRAVVENLRRLLTGFTGTGDAPVALMRQVHGADVVVVGEDVQPGRAEDALAAWPEADALVTRQPGVTLLVRVADCVPVLLADPQQGVVGAVHVGRAGLVAGVVPRAVRALRELGAGELRGWLGPSICGRCYEVPAQMRAEVAEAVPAAWSVTSWNTPAVDVGAGVRAQLEQAEVAIHDAAVCTLESAALYSHRRDGKAAGRAAGLIRVRDDPR